MGPGRLGLVERGARHRALRKQPCRAGPGCRNEIQRASHYTPGYWWPCWRPLPPPSTWELPVPRGLGIDEAMLENKKDTLPFYSLPFLSAWAQPWGHTHTHVQKGHSERSPKAFLRLCGNYSSLTSPTIKNKQLDPPKITPTTGSATSKECFKTTLSTCNAMFVLGIGTLLGGGGGRTQKGHGEKRSRVENYHPSRVAEAVQLLKPSVHGGRGGVRPMCPSLLGLLWGIQSLSSVCMACCCFKLPGLEDRMPLVPERSL